MPHSTNDETHTMSRPSSTSTGSANAFPKQAGATLLAPEPAGGQMSPSRSTFSFDDSSPKSVQGSDKAGDVVVRPASRGAAAAADRKPPAPLVHSVIPQQRKQYFEDKFAYKDDATSSARDRVTKDAPIVAELRTNVIVKDEYTLVTDLSHHLSTRYQRPESSIMITVNHSACLLLGGSFEPTYVLTISALPIQVQPTTNKRNAAMIQAFLSESIGVPAERGILKFVPIPEDSLAINGMTILGEIERLEKQYADENGSSLKRGLTKSSRRSAVSKSKSSGQLSRSNSKAANGGVRAVVTPPIPSPRPFDSGVAVDEKGADQLTPLQPVENFHARKSSMGRTPSKRVFGDKSGSKANAGGLHGKSVTMTIPDDAPKPKIGKRKSFMTVFRR